MKSTALIIVLAMGVLLTTACQPGATPTQAEATAPPAAPTEPPAPTETAVPSTLPPPTATSEPSPTQPPTQTPLPAGVLFRDDFNGALQPGWEWQDENPAKWIFTGDGWLQIIGEVNSLLGEKKQTNLLWYPLPEGDFMITVHLRTKPFENFHQAAIFIYEDADNYITINRGYCDLCPPAGNGVFMDYKIAGEWGSYSAPLTAEDVYLRLESKGEILSGYYATEEGQWTRLGRFGNYFRFRKVGIGVSNARAASDVVGLFDYFEIALP